MKTIDEVRQELNVAKAGGTAAIEATLARLAKEAGTRMPTVLEIVKGFTQAMAEAGFSKEEMSAIVQLAAVNTRKIIDTTDGTGIAPSSQDQGLETQIG